MFAVIQGRVFVVERFGGESLAKPSSCAHSLAERNNPSGVGEPFLRRASFRHDALKKNISSRSKHQPDLSV